MKKIIIFVAFIAFISSVLNASLAFDIGFYTPSNSKTSVIWGLETFRVIDERVFLNFMGSFFYKEYHEYRVIAPGDPLIQSLEINKTDYRFSTYYIPLMAGVKIHVAEFEDLRPFVGGGLGYGIAWQKVFRDLEETTGQKYSDTRFYGGFTWQLNLGAAYRLGSASEVYAKFFYNGADYKRNTGRHEWDRLDMSGIGASLGLRMLW
jgi:hypothetical protein